MTLTLQQLEANPMRKEDAIRLLDLKTFDYALPEPWLIEFCKRTGLDSLPMALVRAIRTGRR